VRKLKEHPFASKIDRLQQRAEAAESEAAHLRSLVEGLRADRERLRQRVLQVASGELCSKCAEKPDAEAPRVKRPGGRSPIEQSVVAEALRRVAAGVPVERVALSLGVSASSIRLWRRCAAEAAAQAAPEPTPPPEAPPPATLTNASYVGPYPERERVHAKGWDPACVACRGRTCDGQGQTPCVAGAA